MGWWVGFVFFFFCLCVCRASWPWQSHFCAIQMPGREVLQNRNKPQQTANIPQTYRNTGKAATGSNSCNTLPNLTLRRSGRTHALPCSTITPAASHHSHPHRAPYPAQPPGCHDTVPRPQHKRAARWRSASACFSCGKCQGRSGEKETSWNIPFGFRHCLLCV